MAFCSIALCPRLAFQDGVTWGVSRRLFPLGACLTAQRFTCSMAALLSFRLNRTPHVFSSTLRFHALPACANLPLENCPHVLLVFLSQVITCTLGQIFILLPLIPPEYSQFAYARLHCSRWSATQVLRCASHLTIIRRNIHIQISSTHFLDNTFIFYALPQYRIWPLDTLFWGAMWISLGLRLELET